MNRRASLPGPSWRAGILRAVVPLVVLAGLAGCLNQQARLQSEDDSDLDRYAVQTVGDITTVGNAEPTPVGGVGLVEGLDGTGGEAANDSFRQTLEHELQIRGYKKIKEMLADPDKAMVLVSASIPPGASKGDTFDVDVAIPPRSRATSLRGGYLKECILFNYDMTRNLSHKPGMPQGTLKGHPIGRAVGPVLVGFGAADEASRQKQGKIWGGGRTVIDNPLTLLLNSDYQFASKASQVADRVNEAFNGTARGVPGNTVATARSPLIVSLYVPAQYRLNLPRFLRVVRLVPNPLEGKPGDASGRGEEAGAARHRPYREQLAIDLADPTRTLTAALRLEALGQASIPTLKSGLDSKDWLVRFCAAEALAYLGSPASGDELARAVQEPKLRAFALTALASLDEAVSQVKLQEMLQTATEPEIRYGAFRALQTLDAHNANVQGELLNHSFWLHQVAPDRQSMVHVNGHRKAEVVIFGVEPLLLPPFSFAAGDFVLTATRDDNACTISRIPPHGGEPVRRQCSLKLTAVLRTMAEMECLYPEVVELLQQANTCQVLTCPLCRDALPRATSVYELARLGRPRPPGEAPADTSSPAPELGSNSLFETVHTPARQPQRDEDALLRQNNGKPENKAAQRRSAPDE